MKTIKNFWLSVVFSFTLICLTHFHASAETFQPMLEFSVPKNSEMEPNQKQSPLAHVNGRTFFVWVDPSNRPMITQKVAGVVTTVPVDSNPDYVAFRDAHHGFSLGIDRLGYIHITGDMHFYPEPTPGRNPPLPSRYVDQNSMYWISNRPYDISGGFRYAGALNSKTALPGFNFTYPKFHHSQNRDLYFSALCRAMLVPDNSMARGSMGLCLYKYNPDRQSWTALGKYPQPTIPNNGPKWKVIFWEEAGINQWFQGFIPGIQFDNQNRLHLAGVSNIDSNHEGSSILFYGVSPDGGTTWKRADGSSIPGLPLRGIQSHPNHADIVYDTQGASFLEDATSVTADGTGSPLINNTGVWRRWDGTKWNANVSNPQQALGEEAVLGPDNVITLLSDWYYFARWPKMSEASSAYMYENIVNGTFTYKCVSTLGLQTTGLLVGVVLDSPDNMLKVYRMAVTSAPLPSGWTGANIGKSQFGGSADYSPSQLILRGSGLGAKGNSDALFYSYRSLTGDGSIVAKIDVVNSGGSGATSGLMMRESTSVGSKFVLVGITAELGARMTYRSTIGGQASDFVDNRTRAPYWVKLERKGNVFSSYLSSDGKNWSLVSSPRTISMNQTITVGVIDFSADTRTIHRGTFENLVVTPPLSTGGTGLRGQYYPNMTLTGTPVLTRTDPTINFEWVLGSPGNPVPADLFSVRWTGQVRAPYSEMYNFCTSSDDGVRLTINGLKIIDNWTDHALMENCGQINLTAGQKYSLLLEFYDNRELATIKLYWSSPSISKQIIDRDYLYP